MPHLAPATRHANTTLSLAPSPRDSLCIMAALNVSPAPRVSTIFSGEKAGEEWSYEWKQGDTG